MSDKAKNIISLIVHYGQFTEIPYSMIPFRAALWTAVEKFPILSVFELSLKEGELGPQSNIFDHAFVSLRSERRFFIPHGQLVPRSNTLEPNVLAVQPLKQEDVPFLSRDFTQDERDQMKRVSSIVAQAFRAFT
jgi:hypothetical protein